jgi:hypothetical protein
VGSSHLTATRMSQYRTELRRDTHDNAGLQKAWNRYGEAAFRFAVLQALPLASELLVAGSHPAVLLQAIDAALDPIALAIELAVEVALRAFVGLGRDDVLDTVPTAVAAHFAAAVAFVADQTLRAPPGSARPARLTAPRTMSGSNTLCSWRWPAVTSRTRGLPPRSARTWSLVLMPPRLWPGAC